MTSVEVRSATRRMLTANCLVCHATTPRRRHARRAVLGSMVSPADAARGAPLSAPFGWRFALPMPKDDPSSMGRSRPLIVKYTDPPPTRDLGAAGRDGHTVFNRELIGVFLCVLDSHTNHYILCSMFYPGTEGTGSGKYPLHRPRDACGVPCPRCDTTVTRPQRRQCTVDSGPLSPR